MTDFRRGILLSSELCMRKSSIGETSGTRAIIEGSGVLDERLSSRCRITWSQPTVLFCMG